MKEEQKVYIKGVPNRGNEIIKELEKQGGINCQLDGEDSKYLYYITHEGSISLALIDSEFGRIIMDNYKEIKVSDRWKTGDILVNDKNPNEFYVFDKISEREKIFVNLKIIKSPIEDKILGITDIYNVISYIPYHKANDKELKTFYSLLAARDLTWDAYNKELLHGDYTYFYPKNGHYYFRRNTIRCKDRSTGEWYDAVLYSDVNGQYVRELNDFNKKFEKI